MSHVDPEKLEKLWEVCANFIERQEIGCSEDIHQSDRVIENAYTLVQQICEVVGYHKEQSDE